MDRKVENMIALEYYVDTVLYGAVVFGMVILMVVLSMSIFGLSKYSKS